MSSDRVKNQYPGVMMSLNPIPKSDFKLFNRGPKMATKNTALVLISSTQPQIGFESSELLTAGYRFLTQSDDRHLLENS